VADGGRVVLRGLWSHRIAVWRRRDASASGVVIEVVLRNGRAC